MQQDGAQCKRLKARNIALSEIQCYTRQSFQVVLMVPNDEKRRRRRRERQFCNRLYPYGERNGNPPNELSVCCANIRTVPTNAIPVMCNAVHLPACIISARHTRTFQILIANLYLYSLFSRLQTVHIEPPCITFLFTTSVALFHVSLFRPVKPHIIKFTAE